VPAVLDAMRQWTLPQGRWMFAADCEAYCATKLTGKGVPEPRGPPNTLV